MTRTRLNGTDPPRTAFWGHFPRWRFHGNDPVGNPVWPVLVGAWRPRGSYFGKTSVWPTMHSGSGVHGRPYGSFPEVAPARPPSAYQHWPDWVANGIVAVKPPS